MYYKGDNLFSTLSTSLFVRSNASCSVSRKTDSAGGTDLERHVPAMQGVEPQMEKFLVLWFIRVTWDLALSLIATADSDLYCFLSFACKSASRSAGASSRRHRIIYGRGK